MKPAEFQGNREGSKIRPYCNPSFPSKEDWKNIADDFMTRWQFPHCVGAIDGRHMRIKAPPRSGSTYYNYKQFFSMVLLATSDARYKFPWVDVGQYGKNPSEVGNLLSIEMSNF